MIKDALKAFLFRVASGVRTRAKEIAPYKTGNLKKDIQVFDDGMDEFKISVGNTTITPYAKFVHFGTRPHLITPKNKRVLASRAAIYGKLVRHPGTGANPYLSRAFYSYVGGGEFEQAKNDLAQKLADKLAKDIKITLKGD
ncbi:HK97 gp10 family phage protein [Campylobacter sp. FMV-PI01]|uniref:HK97 gp10 family phage protein n=1 Tax=Campylobacter portucalensis TaxID=2608384 RepID=A0A6L5WK09_9BACT|nr:HK97 gp10 family phage protein [Campylobacter portucalensis]MSN96772.1 HK97 gp10 family phage protein [Campylobacter portucalensis]